MQKLTQRESPNGIEHGERRDQPVREEQSTRTTDEREKHTLGKKLPDEAAAASAERPTQRQFPLAPDAAG